MSRKQCKRKHYPLNPNIVGRVIENVALIDPKNLDRIRMLELSQIESLATGAGTLSDLRGLSDCLNVCETIADAGIGKEALPVCERAQEAILAIMRRFERWGKIEATPAEIDALRDLFAWHDAQREILSVAEYERMIAKTSARIRSNHHKCKVIA